MRLSGQTCECRCHDAIKEVLNLLEGVIGMREFGCGCDYCSAITVVSDVYDILYSCMPDDYET